MGLNSGETTSKQDESYQPSHSFSVRLWPEEMDNGQIEWRGQVQHVLSGEVQYFRDWSTLIGYLLTMLPNEKPERESSATEGNIGSNYGQGCPYQLKS
jgi:hypothetical protein